MAFVLCLDSLANGDELFMHVSRPPKPDTPMHSFIQTLEEVTSRKHSPENPIQRSLAHSGPSRWLSPALQVVSSRFPSVRSSLVHKKINLGESTVAWEHERYSLRRVPSFTLSRVGDPKSELRGSILDTL